MSRTDMYVVRKSGDVTFRKDYQNSHGSAPAVWTYLWDKYIREPSDPDWKTWLTDADSLWALAKDSRLDDTDRIALVFTFDRLIFGRKTWPRLVEVLKESYQRSFKNGYVNHLSTIAEDIEQLKDEEDIIGVCFNMTSISCDFWTVYEEEDEESRTYNINTDDKHDFLEDLKVD